ncbi:MAG: TIM-barrel domain-containing protein [Bacteroidia bacterium]
MSSKKNRRKGSTFNESVGNYLSHQVAGQEIHIQTENALVKVIIYDKDLARIRIAKNEHDNSGFSYAIVQEPLTIAYDFVEATDSLTVKTDAMKLVINKSPLRINTYTPEDELLTADDPAFGTSWLGNEVTTYKSLQPNERFIGLGEKTGGLDRRGKAYVNWNTDNFAYATDGDPLYLSTPFYMGINEGRTYGIFFDNSHKTTFSFGCSNERFSYFQAEDGEMNYYIFTGKTVASIIDRYTWLTGRMELPPLWSLGFQQCRYSYYPYPEVLNAARTFREKHIPADVLYLDIHYMEAYKVFTWHPDRFPDPAGLVKQLKEMGFNLVVILDPGVKREEGYHAYEDGKSKDLFVKYPDGAEYNGQVWPGWSAFPDFTEEKARAWWGEQMKALTEYGVEGFWNDMNEPAAWGQHLPDLIEFEYEGEGGTLKKTRNVYGMQMARSTVEGGKKHLNGNRPFVLTRAGYSGIQRYAAVWTGDNVSTDDHMMAGVRLINSMGLTGIGYAGYDVGGFAGEASPELFARWIALGAFSPFFRSHSMVNSRDSEPWSFGEEVEDISRNYIRLRYRLMPYIYSSFYETTQSGMPIARSLAIDYTNDPKIYEGPYDNQYLFGPSIMVIPAESTCNFQKAYLPAGNWINLYTDALQEGGKELVLQESKETLPLYVKAGSILLMQSAVESLLNEKSSDVLEVHIYPGADASFTHYEDDGKTYGYQKGASVKRTFKLSGNKLEITSAEGDYTSHYTKLRVYLHTLSPSNVQVNGLKASIEKENYRFTEPVSDFDPYHVPPKDPIQVTDLSFVEAKFDRASIQIDWN